MVLKFDTIELQLKCIEIRLMNSGVHVLWNHMFNNFFSCPYDIYLFQIGTLCKSVLAHTVQCMLFYVFIASSQKGKVVSGPYLAGPYYFCLKHYKDSETLSRRLQNSNLWVGKNSLSFWKVHQTFCQNLSYWFCPF